MLSLDPLCGLVTLILVGKVLFPGEKLFNPKKYGGLNIIELGTWNNTTMLKLLWNICRKFDNLWVKWVHSYYIKGDMLMDMEEKASYLCIVRSTLKQLDNIMHMQTFWQQMIRGNKFSTKKVYLNMRSMCEDNVNWSYVLYGNTARPRVVMTLWLTCHGRLAVVISAPTRKP